MPVAPRSAASTTGESTSDDWKSPFLSSSKILMEKVAVHGPRAHPVYNFLRATTGATPSWNFGVYFVVSRSGEVKAYPDVAPAQLAGVLRGEL